MVCHWSVKSVGARYAASCWMLSRPKTEVWKQVVPALAVMRQPGVRVVGIHMRTTDVFAWKRGDYSLEYVWQQTHSSLLRCAQVSPHSCAQGE